MKKPAQDHTSSLTAGPEFVMRPIGFARTPYKERYGTPHQANSIRGTREGHAVEGTIELEKSLPLEVLRGLEGFDYIWLLYVFHLNEGWNALVRPPRGPRVKRGVLATRAPHRPNSIGLSAVRVVSVSARIIAVRGIDLLDGTPILDVKPYIPYADAFPDAKAGWVDEVDALQSPYQDDRNELEASRAEAADVEADAASEEEINRVSGTESETVEVETVNVESVVEADASVSPNR